MKCRWKRNLKRKLKKKIKDYLKIEQYLDKIRRTSDRLMTIGVRRKISTRVVFRIYLQLI
jgi:hypothetical protein